MGEFSPKRPRTSQGPGVAGSKRPGWRASDRLENTWAVVLWEGHTRATPEEKLPTTETLGLRAEV